MSPVIFFNDRFLIFAIFTYWLVEMVFSFKFSLVNATVMWLLVKTGCFFLDELCFSLFCIIWCGIRKPRHHRYWFRHIHSHIAYCGTEIFLETTNIKRSCSNVVYHTLWTSCTPSDRHFATLMLPSFFPYVSWYPRFHAVLLPSFYYFHFQEINNQISR